MRVTKAPEVRREELLDVAFELCRSHGFEAMSVEQVTQSAGVAKGTFYHYFNSKHAMLGELARRFGEHLFDHLASAVDGSSGNGSRRLQVLMDAARSYKIAQLDITYASFLYRPENLALRHQLFVAWRERAREVLLPIIRDGQADGSFHVHDAAGAADLVLLLWFEAADNLWARGLAASDAEEFAEVMVSGSMSIQQAQERILGVPDGTYTFRLDPESIELTKQLYTTFDRKH